MMAKILLLDDEPQIRRVIALHLGKHGHEVTTGGDGREGLDRLDRERFDLVLTDLRMPRVSGKEVLEAMREQGRSIPVIVLTAFASIESAVEAMKLGAADYIVKPPQLDEITIKVDHLLAQQALMEENRRLRKALEERFRFEGIVGRSPVLRQILEKVKTLARDPAITILLAGESGTGKELVARTIHHHSPRSQFPFMALNCGALPEALLESELFGHERGAFTGAIAEKKGLFEVTHRGSLFLDEISAAPPAVQAKLLRALEEREIRRVGGTKTIPVDLRIISASNQDLEHLVEEGAFRNDLYYRLAVATIHLPPLRERQGDVPLLVNHFLEHFNGEKNKTLTMDTEAMGKLEAYGWPGNVRELEHLIELLVVLVPSGTITAAHLPGKYRNPPAHGLAVPPDDLGDDLKAATKGMTAAFEREFILRQLEKHRWNITHTAQVIGLSRAALHMKMKQYGLAAD